jgi:O-antigen biosynthesis protein
MPAPTAQRTICVLGFHRSGTSLTARALSVLGVHLGDDLLPAHETDNPQGYWEPRWMVDLNDELLEALGTTWWQPFPDERGWQEVPAVAALRERAAAQYAAQLGDAQLSGWKDPRSTLTLPFWQEIAGDPDAAYVICVRNPVDAIASVQRRPEPTLPTHEWGELWLEYTARALQGTAGRRRVLLFHDAWFEDPAAQIARLAELVGLAADDPRLREAGELVVQDMRHHRSSPADLAGAPGLSAPARAAFLALQAEHDLRRATGDAAAAARLGDAVERVCVDLWQASRAAARTARAASASQLHAEGLEAVVRQREDELATLRRELDEQLATERARADSLDAALLAAQAEVERLRQHAHTLERSLSWRVTAPLRGLSRGARRPRSH